MWWKSPKKMIQFTTTKCLMMIALLTYRFNSSSLACPLRLMVSLGGLIGMILRTQQSLVWQCLLLEERTNTRPPLCFLQIVLLVSFHNKTHIRMSPLIFVHIRLRFHYFLQGFNTLNLLIVNIDY